MFTCMNDQFIWIPQSISKFVWLMKNKWYTVTPILFLPFIFLSFLMVQSPPLLKKKTLELSWVLIKVLWGLCILWDHPQQRICIVKQSMNHLIKMGDNTFWRMHKLFQIIFFWCHINFFPHHQELVHCSVSYSPSFILHHSPEFNVSMY